MQIVVGVAAMDTWVITGIGTDVGKTVVAAVLAEALGADYWKPVACGVSDRETVAGWLTDGECRCHREVYHLAMPASPHTAARAQGLTLDPRRLVLPSSTSNLVVEGVGGVLCPFDDTSLLIDHCSGWQARWLVVSRHYLGSINHTLMTVECLRARGIQPSGIVFNGLFDSEVEHLIVERTGLRVMGRINPEPAITADVIRRYARVWQGQPQMQALLRPHQRTSGSLTASVR